MARAGGWLPLDIVRNVEGQADELAGRLRHVNAVIAAIALWTGVEQDPARALAEIRGLVQGYLALPWVAGDTPAEGGDTT
jgi:hypothetical protein